MAAPSAYANTALDLDGVDDRLLLTGGEGSVYDVANSNFTLEMWVKTSSTTAQSFFSMRNGSGLDDRYALAMRAEGTVAAAFLTGSDVVSGASTVTVNDGDWHHLAMVRTGAYSLLVYIDGVLAITGSRTGPSTLSSIDTNRYPSVGSDYTGSRVEDRRAFMDGQIDELRFWNYARTATQIADNKNIELQRGVGSVYETGLVAYFDFEGGLANGNNSGHAFIENRVTNDDGSLTGFALTGSSSNFVSATDLTLKSATEITLSNYSAQVGGAAFTVTATSNRAGAISYASSDTDVFTINSATGVVTIVGAGTATVTASQASTSDYLAGTATATITVGAPNTVLDFDGTNDRIVLNSAKNVLNFGTSDFTIEFLIKTSTTAASSFVVTRSSGEGDRYIIGLSATGFLGAYYNLGGADDMALTGTTALNDGDWHHVAVVRQGPTVTAYIDGAFETSDTAADPIRSSLDTNYAPTIGADYYPDPARDKRNFLDGQMDELRFWNDARSVSEINDNRLSSLAGDEDNLVVYYDFEQGVVGGDNRSIFYLTAQNSTYNGTIEQFTLLGSSSNFVTPTGLALTQTPSLSLSNLTRTVGDASPTMTATSNSDGAISYASADTDVATINSTTGVVTLVAAGTTTITATQAADGGYSAGSVTATLTIKASNSSPAASGAPTSFTVTEDVETALSFAAMSVSDTDGDPLNLSFEADAGTFSALTSSGSVVATRPSADKIVLTGPAANLTSYLDSNSLRYTPAANANGSGAAEITVKASDGTAEPTLATVDIDITAVNDAPVLNDSFTPTFGTIVRNAGDDDGSGADSDDDASDNTNNPGVAVADLVPDGSISDLEGAVKGVAVIGFDNSAAGKWYYSLDNGTTWTLFNSVASTIDSTNSAVLLDGTTTGAATNRIRFVPTLNATATPTLTYVAWDKSTGSAGSRVNVSTRGGSTAFSSASDTATLTVSGGNAWPTANSFPGSLTFSEDTSNNAVNFSSATLADADGDSLTLTLSITAGSFSAPESGTGVTVSGSGLSISLAGTATALNTYLDTAANIKFTPAANAFGSPYATLTYTLNDGTVDGATGTVAINVADVNDRPILDISGAPTFTTRAEDVASSVNVGDSVASLVIDGSISDLDGAVEAIAVTEIDNTNGLWYYSLNNGSTWNVFSGASEVLALTSARLLDGSLTGSATNKLRFVPNANWSGSTTIKYRAWDKSSGTAGGVLDLTGTFISGTEPFSSAEETATLTFSSVNDAPEITTPWSMSPFTEDTEGDLRMYYVVLADVDGDTLTFTASVDGGTIVSVNNGAAQGVTATKESDTSMKVVGSASAINTYLDQTNYVRYMPPANVSGTSLTLSFIVSDGTLSATGSETIRITAVNDAPVLVPSASTFSTTVRRDAGGATGFDSGNNGYALTGIVRTGDITDVDGTPPRSIVVTQVDNRYGKWQYSTAWFEHVRYVSYYPGSWRDFSSTTGAIVDLTSNSVLLEQTSNPPYIRYVPNPSTVGTATLTYRAWDESGGGSTGSIVNTSVTGGSTPYSAATDFMSVRTMADPVISNFSGDIARAIGGSDAYVDVGQDATVVDIDSSRFTRLQLAMVSGERETGDEFDIDTTGDVTVSGTTSGSSVLVDGVAVGTFNRNLPAETDITFTLNVSASPAAVQKLLRSLVYRNTDSSRIDYSEREIRTIFKDEDSNEVRITSYVREAAGDADGDVIAASGIDESASIELPTSKNTLAEAVAVMDFTITDGGTSDGLPLRVTRIGVALSGTMSYSERITLKFVLDGPDVSNKVGSWGSGSGLDAAFSFSSLPISIADGGSETYTLKVYADPTKSYTSGRTVITTIDGDDPYRWYVQNTGTEMKVSTTAVTNGTGFTVNVASSGFSYTTMPTEIDAGAAFSVVVKATDSGGGVDSSFTEDVTISLASGAGTLSGTTTVAAVAGVATFSNLVYTAAADGETFTLSANDEDGSGSDLTPAVSASVTADVVASKLIFLRQPSTLSTVSGATLRFSEAAQMRIAAVDASNVVDTDYTGSITLSEINGAGVGRLFVSSDVGETISRSAVAGIAEAWPSSGVIYTNASTVPASVETFNFQASATGLTSAVSDGFSSVYPESTGTFAAASGVTEPVSIPTTAVSRDTAVPIFDFVISDGGVGASDGLPLTITDIRVRASGTTTDAERGRVFLMLNGPDLTDKAENYTASYDLWHFDIESFPIQVADGASETYTVSAYFAVAPVITDGATLILSVDADRGSDVVVHPMSTRMAPTEPLVSDSVGSAFSVDATRLSFTTEPGSSVSGEVFGRQPVVTAFDAAGNIDTDFTETVTISKKTGDGTLAGTFTATAVAGVASFTDLVYSATADGEAFVLSADDDAAVGSDLAAVDSASTSSDVVATKLTFSTEPAPLTVVSGQEQVMTTVPVVRAVDADDLLDTDYTTAVTLSEVSGAGSALMSVTSDTDSSTATASRAAVAGEATFTGMALTYTTSGAADETFALRASSGGLTTADSATLTAEVPNSDGTLVAAAGVTEPVALDSTVDTAAEAVNVFDFTLSDGGGDDGLGIAVSALNVQLGGTSTDALRAQVTWLLNGPGVVDAAGTYDAANDRLAFTGLGIDIASGASATYTVSAFYNDNTNLIDGSTFVLSITGSSDLTFVGTSVASTTAVTATTPIQVVATGLRFTTLPAGTTAGAVFTTQPVVSAVDDFGNVDTDFTETITLSETSAGAIDGDIDVAAVAGVATFSGLSHKPAADGETLAIVADDEGDLTVGTLSDLPSVTATAITSDVIATQLAFLDEPAPLNVVKARATPLTTVPRVGAVNADGIVDTDRTGTVVLTLVDGAGTIVMSATGDTDGDPAGSETSITLPLTAGVASFTDMSLTYTNSGDANETFKLQASHPTAPSLSTATTVKSAEMRGVVADTDGGLSAAAGVTEPVAIPSTVTSAAAALDVFDFVLSDGASVDSLPLLVNGLAINISGTSSDAVRGQLSWLLNGPDASDVVGSYDAATDKLTFAPLTLSIASGAQETYTVSAYYNDNSSLTDNQTLILSIDGDTDLTLDGSGTQFATTTPVTNGTGSLLEVIATALVFTTEPAGSASGSALTTQPVIAARDAAGNTDTDFAEAVTLTTAGGGTLSRTAGGAVSATATAGVATFTDVIYTASADKQAFTLIANDNDALGSDLPAVTSASLNSEVTATELRVTTQPSPRSVFSGSGTSLRPGPIVSAVDASGAVDVDITGSVVMTETAGPGEATFSLAGDTDTDLASITLPMAAGVASFEGVVLTYNATVEGSETFRLAFARTGFASTTSAELVATPAPPPVDDTITDRVDRTGTTTTDPDIDEGGELTGGEVCGTATSAGKITDVTLCPGAEIIGGEVGGEITGDPDDPAKLTDVTILPGSTLKNVRIGADVILLKGVILGENVGFDSVINVPAGVMLTDTLNKIAVPGQAERMALDLRSQPMAGASQSPRTSYLELVNEEVQTSEPGAKLEQAVDGAVRMEFESSESRLVPVALRKTEDDATGFYFDDDGNLSIRLGENLEIIMYPMFNDEDGFKEQLEKDYPQLALNYDADSNFVITEEDNVGAEATLPRYIGRAGLSAVKATRSTEEGFVFYPNPLLRNLMLVSFVSRNEAGELMEQTMSPVPKDWFRFKERLLREPGVDSIKISSLGLITVVYRNEIWQLMASYDILPNAAIANENRGIVIINAGDLNDDGEADYYLYYPNGDRQTIYIVPR